MLVEAKPLASKMNGYLALVGLALSDVKIYNNVPDCRFLVWTISIS
ncbi:MAG: Unknown protein [uncultured Sulfurovum sp.]|uniref:Uncharacterized protein n=1 Tax=uncultured Sulfurovum sp. TaxID=269237 RepID=A0A6S6RXN2_9BACT|nr:MAG: Unknown protein [uncultured Sulfurovum sp.]